MPKANNINNKHKEKEPVKTFVNNAVARIRALVANKWDTFCRNLPLRMAVGRFGIWLAKVGRVLQTRYANWNSEFRLEHEFYPNPDCCTLHVSESVLTGSDWILTFESPGCQQEKIIPMVRELFTVKGVSRITLNRYEVGVTKARVYRWDELLPKIEAVVLKHQVQRDRDEAASLLQGFAQALGEGKAGVK